MAGRVEDYDFSVEGLEVHPREAAKALKALRSAAAPGPSGFRNAHLKLISLHRGGTELFAQWAALMGLGK
eukprot:6192461-Alexandrium_andersonii.AAC.1